MLQIYTTSWCGDCKATKAVLGQRKIAYQEIDIEQDPQAAEYVMQVNGGRRSVPTLVYEGDAVSLSNFSRAKLDEYLRKHSLL
jgi:mycoredoxin